MTGEWVPTHGVRPDLPGGTPVEVRFKADDSDGTGATVRDWLWTDYGGDMVITHYRLASAAPEAQSKRSWAAQERVRHAYDRMQAAPTINAAGREGMLGGKPATHEGSPPVPAAPYRSRGPDGLRVRPWDAKPAKVAMVFTAWRALK